MARAYFKCADCGDEVAISGHNRADADRKAAWHESQGHLCDGCQQSQFAADNAKAAITNQSDGLPSLTGSEKQVAWAETIRAKKLPDIHATAEKCHGFLSKLDAGDYPKPATQEQIEKARKEIDSNLIAVDIVLSQHRASWWIDNRDASFASLMLALKAQIDEAQTAQLVAAATPDELAIEDAAKAEALLRPAGEPVSSNIAEISHVGETLRVIFPEKCEDFRLLLRAAGFTWQSIRWERRLDFKTGEPADRMADLAHRLIAAGFLVRLHDPEAHELAISGQFKPEQQRWVCLSKGGEYNGWLKIMWPKGDDFYAPAKRILGSRYNDHAICVPPGSIEEVNDFALQYGFSLSETPQRLLEMHRAALAGGAVIANPKTGPEPVRIEAAKTPEKLEARPSNIDDELRDDEGQS